MFSSFEPAATSAHTDLVSRTDQWTWPTQGRAKTRVASEQRTHHTCLSGRHHDWSGIWWRAHYGVLHSDRRPIIQIEPEDKWGVPPWEESRWSLTGDDDLQTGGLQWAGPIPSTLRSAPSKTNGGCNYASSAAKRLAPLPETAPPRPVPMVHWVSPMYYNTI